MPLWEIVIVAAIIAAIAVLVMAATKSGTIEVQRATTIAAPPEKIFPLVNDFKNWPAWSPYEKKDPAMKRSLSGAPNGKGAVYEWDGNAKVGKGRIEIADAAAPSRVTIKLDMIKPMEGHNLVNFTFEPLGSATRVTWAMQGACGAYIAKLLGLFLNMDKMVGRDFEAGLASLKALAEK